MKFNMLSPIFLKERREEAAAGKVESGRGAVKCLGAGATQAVGPGFP